MMIPIPVRTSMLLINCVQQLLVTNSTIASRVLVINYDATFRIPIIRYDWRKEATVLFESTVIPDIYVVKTELSHLNSTFQSLKKNIMSNPNAKTIFITNKFNQDMFFGYFKETYLDDMIVIVDNSKTQLYIKKYNTFREGKSNMKLLIDIENCTFFEAIVMCNKSETKKIEVSTLKVGLSYNPPSVVLKRDNTTEGIDVDVLGIIANKLNITMDFYFVDEFVGMRVEENFSFTGALGSLDKGDVDLVAGGLFPRRDSYLSFSTRPTTVNRFVWIVPAAKSRPYWKRLLSTYSSSVWTFLVLTFLTTLMVASVVNRITTKKNYFFGTELLKLYAMCLTSIEVKYTELMPKRILYISWYLFLIVFSNYFTAKLSSNFVVKKYEYQIHSKDELVDTNWKICMFTDLAEYIKSYGNQKIVTCNNCEHCVNRTAKERDLVSIRSENLMKYEMNRLYVNEDGEPLVFFLDQYFLVTYDIIIFRKNHPVYRRFDELLYTMADSGLYRKIMSKYTPKKISKMKAAWKGLEFRQLSFIFLFVMFVFSISIFLFILEVELRSRNILDLLHSFLTSSSTTTVSSFLNSKTKRTNT